MLTYPHINPIALEIGPLRIHWYGIMYLVAFSAAWILARRRAAQPGSTWSARAVDDFIFYAMLGTIVGGRVGYVLFYGQEMWRADPWYPLKLWEGGMSFHGGFLGVLAAVALFARQGGRRVWDVADFAAPLPGIGIFAVRIGNFINSELWGKPTDGWWGMRVRESPGAPLIARHPSQLYEAGLEGIVLFTVLWWYTRKPRPRYLPSALFLLCYASARISVEFVRLPDAQLGYLAGGWLTMGMVLSLPLLAAGLLLLTLGSRWRQPSGNFTVGAGPVGERP
ncbi:MAG TPA: prolipoprotein diacylglyceryl transferase [Steroidobacteraceae bacterium]|nr:prolipoprotein diacylglyceryl transferase [Steroidobacteraceae bacterium]